MSKLTEALIGRDLRESEPRLSPEQQQFLEALESNPLVIQEGKKHLIDILQLALKMDSLNSIKHMVRRVLKSMDPQPNPFDKEDKDKPPEPPAKRPPAVKVPPAVPSAAPAAA